MIFTSIVRVLQQWWHGGPEPSGYLYTQYILWLSFAEPSLSENFTGLRFCRTCSHSAPSCHPNLSPPTNSGDIISRRQGRSGHADPWVHVSYHTRNRGFDRNGRCMYTRYTATITWAAAVRVYEVLDHEQCPPRVVFWPSWIVVF